MQSTPVLYAAGQVLTRLQHQFPGTAEKVKSLAANGRWALQNDNLTGSFLPLLLHADPVVKLVILVLAGLSVISWSVILQKYFLLKKLNRRADRFDEIFWSGITMEDFFRRIGPTPKDPLSIMFSSAMNELLQNPATTAQIERVLRAAMNRETARLEKNLGLLATTSSVAPFIGLFGTVWGIISAFTAIAGRGQASLAVVAPGIAEALIATAVGLVTAIPATMAYNKFAVEIESYIERLETFIDEFPVVMKKSMYSRAKK